MSELHTLLIKEDDSRQQPIPLNAIQPCFKFLIDSQFDKYYKGGYYKNQKGIALLTFLKQAAVMLAGFMDFISYKFIHKEKILCITFRKMHTSAFIKGINKYHIRLSLIEPTLYSDNRAERDSIMITEHGDLKYPISDGEQNVFVQGDESNHDYARIKTRLEGNCTSITAGQYNPEISLVKDMTELTDGDELKNFQTVVEIIRDNETKLDYLVKILEQICLRSTSSVSQVATQGGYTRKHNRLSRRRKSVLKRKNKKSYRKKNYGKSKKSRRFIRSVRSRR